MIKNYTNIVVAIDVYGDYEKILDTAYNIAKLKNAQLHILSVLNIHYEVLSIAVDYKKAMFDDAEVILNDIVEKYSTKLQNVTKHISFGISHIEINKYAKNNKCDLIVLGSHGKHGVNLVLGSTSNSVLHHAVCDVLTVRLNEKEEKFNKYNKVVFATDLTNESCKVLDVAKKFEESFNSKLIAINVIADSSLLASSYGVLLNDNNDEETNEKIKEDVLNWKNNNNFDGEFVVLKGETSYQINHYSNDNNVDLIVVGSHERGAIARFFLGSTANSVLHHAEKDVLVVKL